MLDLSRALAVAFSTAAFALVTNTIWQLGVALGWVRLTVLTAASITAMVVSLIVIHDLWRAPSARVDRNQATLFNAVTVITLVIGAVCLYAVLFALSLLVAGLIIEGGVLEGEVGHAVDVGDYAALAWFASSLAMIGATLGSGLEKEVDIGEAAYGSHPDRRSPGS